MIQKPPWTARDRRERQEMIDWVISQLNKLETPDATTPAGRRALEKLIGKKGGRKFLALGNACNQRKKQEDANWALNAAVDTVPIIRQIWQDEYGQQNRHADDGASAEEIAATLFNVNIDHLLSRSRKPSGGPRKRKITRTY